MKNDSNLIQKAVDAFEEFGEMLRLWAQGLTPTARSRMHLYRLKPAKRTRHKRRRLVKREGRKDR